MLQIFTPNLRIFMGGLCWKEIKKWSTANILPTGGHHKVKDYESTLIKNFYLKGFLLSSPFLKPGYFSGGSSLNNMQFAGTSTWSISYLQSLFIPSCENIKLKKNIKISSFAWNFAILPRFLSGFPPFVLPAEEAR